MDVPGAYVRVCPRALDGSTAAACFARLWAARPVSGCQNVFDVSVSSELVAPAVQDYVRRRGAAPVLCRVAYSSNGSVDPVHQSFNEDFMYTFNAPGSPCRRIIVARNDCLWQANVASGGLIISRGPISGCGQEFVIRTSHAHCRGQRIVVTLSACPHKGAPDRMPRYVPRSV